MPLHHFDDLGVRRQLDLVEFGRLLVLLGTSHESKGNSARALGQVDGACLGELLSDFGKRNGHGPPLVDSKDVLYVLPLAGLLGLHETGKLGLKVIKLLGLHSSVDLRRRFFLLSQLFGAI